MKEGLQNEELNQEEASKRQIFDDLAALEQEALEQEAPSVSDEEMAEAAAAEVAADAGYKMGAQMAVGFVAQMIALKWPSAVVPDEGREQVAEALAPVMRKYGGGLPDWLLPYQEELHLGLTVAGVAFGVAMQVRMAKAAEAAEAEAEEKAAAAEGEQAASKESKPKAAGTAPDGMAFLQQAQG